MALQPYQLDPNVRLNVGGSEGVIAQSGNHITAVTREDGTVDWYSTEYIRENGEVTLTDAEQNQVQSDQQQIDALRQQIAELEAAQTESAPGPAAVSEPDPTAAPVTTETTGDRQQTA